jgi:WD40 repeat protein
MSAAHAAGVVHRDLKPSNILFAGGDPEADLGKLTPKVADFGLARKLDGAGQTHTGAVLGTPSYMAPEQAAGLTQDHGPPVDVYALGAILYECLTGRPPFRAATPLETVMQVIRDEPVPIRRLNPAVPRDLETIAHKCLAKDPARRYGSAVELADDLRRYQAGEPIVARPVGALERGWRWCKRNPVVAGLLAALVSVTVTGLVLVSWALFKAEARGEELARANTGLGEANTKLGTAEAEASRRADEAEEGGYLSDVALAHQLWKANDLRAMRTVLDRCPPSRRRWEWYFLDGLTRPERDVLSTNGPPLALVYSPDGKALAYQTQNGTVAVIDVASGTERFRVQGQVRDLIAPLAFRPDGAELAFTGEGGVRAIDLTTGQFRDLAVKAGLKPCLALAYTNRGLLAVVEPANLGGPYELREVATGKLLARFPVPPVPVGQLAQVAGAAFSPDSRLFAAALVDSGILVGFVGDKPPPVLAPVVRIWDTELGTLVREVEAGTAFLGSIVFAPDSKAVGYGRRGQVAETSIGGPTSPRFATGHAGNVVAVSFDGNGLIWSGGEDRLVLGHDRATGTERIALRGCSNAVTRLAVSPDGQEVAAAVGDLSGGPSAVYRFRLAGPRADTWRAPTSTGSINVVAALSADGERAAALAFTLGGGAPRFVLRDVLTGTEHRPARPDRWLRSTFRPGGGLAVVEEQLIRLLDPDGVEVGTIPLPENTKNTPPLLACPSEDVLAAVMAAEVQGGDVRARAAVRLAVWGKDAKKWQSEVRAELKEVLPAAAEKVAVMPLAIRTDPEGRRVAVAVGVFWIEKGQRNFHSRGAVLVWDLATGTEVFRRRTDEPMLAVGFDPDGRLIAGGGGPGSGRLLGWDLATGATVRSWTGHGRPIVALAFGPDGRVATGGADRVVKLWDAATGRVILTLEGFPGEVTQVAFTRTGTLVAATGLDWMTAQFAAGGTPLDSSPAEVRLFRATR